MNKYLVVSPIMYKGKVRQVGSFVNLPDDIAQDQIISGTVILTQEAEPEEKRSDNGLNSGGNTTETGTVVFGVAGEDQTIHANGATEETTTNTNAVNDTPPAKKTAVKKAPAKKAVAKKAAKRS